MNRLQQLLRAFTDTSWPPSMLNSLLFLQVAKARMSALAEATTLKDEFRKLTVAEGNLHNQYMNIWQRISETEDKDEKVFLLEEMCLLDDEKMLLEQKSSLLWDKLHNIGRNLHKGRPYPLQRFHCRP